MSTATALQLANRVQRMLRGEDLTSVTNAEGAVLLDLLNDAIGIVLGERVWDFQIQQTPLQFFEAQTLTNQSVANGTSSFSPTGGAIGWAWPYQGRMVVTSDPTYGSQSFRLTNQTAGTPTYSLDSVFYGTSSGTATVLWLCYEYILSSLIRAVISIKHESRELRLINADPSVFETMFPRPWDERTDSPTVAVIGGQGTGTIPHIGTTSYGTTLQIWPTPSARLRLDMTYVAMPARLTSAASTLGYVPEHVEEIIVYLAYAKAQQTGVGNEPAAGMALETRILQEMLRRWMSHKPDHGLTRSIIPFDRTGGRNSLYAGLPRIISSGGLVFPSASS